MRITDAARIDEYYRALLTRDSQYLGSFVVGVTTTGICCLPTCRARKPRPEHTEFFHTVGDALRAGYRPCKICRPTEGAGTPPPAVRRALEMAVAAHDQRLTDTDLRRAGIGPDAVRRWCKAHLGFTFHGYQRMLRVNAAYRSLALGTSVTDTAFATGYESLSGFRQRFEAMVDAPPSEIGRHEVIRFQRLETPLGPMLACATDRGLCLLEFTDRRMLETQIRTLTTRLGARMLAGEHPFLDRIACELREYFDGTRTTFDVPLDQPGTPFQTAVWGELTRIPYGETRSYAEQASALGRPTAVRPVAAANGRNRIAIVVPCHRVIGSDGSLTGYGGGLARKRWLLEHERRVSSR
tara:strand:- start:747 stop:1805 length:1059 start_codon:yes stop_codon:yes gene_type:complete